MTGSIGDRGNDPDFESKLERVIAAYAEQAATAREDPAAFFEFVMTEEQTGKQLTIVDHQRLFFDFVNYPGHERCLVRGFAGSSKTYMVAAQTLFNMGCDPGERGLVASATEGQSKKVLGMIRRYIEESDRLHLVFPHLVPSSRRGEPWTQTRITIDRKAFGIRDPSLVAVGIGAKLPGSRLSWMNCDDLLTLQNTISEAAREFTWDWLGSTALSRLDYEGARCLITNTPWFPTDLTYQLERGKDGMKPWPSITFDAEGDISIRNTDWDSPLIRPTDTDNPHGERHRLVSHDSPRYARMCGVDVDLEDEWRDERDIVPLWPERLSRTTLEREKKEMTVLDYNRNRRCIVVDPAKQRVREEYIRLCKSNAVRFGEHHPMRQWAGDSAFTGVDPAFGLNPKNDRSAIFTFAILPSGYKRILEVQVGRWRSGELVNRIVDAATRFQSIVCVEGNAAQRTVRDWAMEKRADILVRARDTTAKNKGDPKFGVESIFMEIEQGTWLIPSDPRTGFTNEGISAWIQDLYDYRPGVHTGDILMASWIAREEARRIFGSLELTGGGESPLGDGGGMNYIGAR